MPRTRAATAALRVIHRWIGLAFLILLLPIAVSGALLVWHDDLDALLNPSRYAVSGAEVKLTPSAYIASAASVLEPGMQPAAVRYPEEPGWPVTVQARGAPSQGGGPGRFLTIFLDPPTGKVLDKMDFRASLFGFLHVFHENLTIPQWSGRAIVGWAGVGMLILCLTGIWIWWPANGAFVRALRYRRTAETMSNLHQLLGFWIAIPLAIVSLTGIYLSFPPQARSLMASIAPMQGGAQRPNFGGRIVTNSALGADKALELALATEAGAKPAVVFLPVIPNNARGGDNARGGETSPTWRIVVRSPSTGQNRTLMIDDKAGTVNTLPPPLAGDRAAQWIRWIHDGGRGGFIWQFIVFLTGVLPVLFGITGVVIWWRRLKWRRRVRAAKAAPQMNPAE